jgi:protocatechuate 3,4-dioxygenase beta subunit
MGGNVVMSFIEKGTLKSARGVVRDMNGELLEGVLVEIFDDSQWTAKKQQANPGESRRIAACKTGADGKFCFINIPAGKYELVSSINAGWNPTYVRFKLNPQSRNSGKRVIEVLMTIGG